MMRVAMVRPRYHLRGTRGRNTGRDPPEAPPCGGPSARVCRVRLRVDQPTHEPDDLPTSGCDRSSSAELVERVLDPGLDDERDDVVAELVALEDPRHAATLEEAVLDRTRPQSVREAAFDVLERLPRDDPPRAALRAWARSDDALVRCYGVGFCGPAEEDLLAEAARHRDPLVRLAALESMMACTRTRALVSAAVQCLGDDEPALREAACRVALFDEPLAMVRGLLRAIDDRESAVRWAAYDALADFPTVAVALALAEPRGPFEDREARDCARASVRTALRRGRENVPRAGRERFESWLRPAAWMLGPPDEVRTDDVGPLGPLRRSDGPDDEGEADGGAPPPVDLAVAERALLDPDTHPAVLRMHLFERGWSESGERGVRLVRACLERGDWLLRLGVAGPLRDLRETSLLTRLAEDCEPVIARAGLAGLYRFDCDAGLDAARALLGDERARPVVGEDALEYVARFAPREETERVLVDELSRPDDRDGLFLSAAHGARRLESKACVPALLALVNAPVIGSVAAHGAALEALRSLGHPRAWIDLSALEDLDHLTIQFELAAWAHPGGRYGS